MARYSYEYDVFDGDVIVLANASSGEVEKAIGINRGKVSIYAAKQWLFRGRYRIASKTMPAKEVKINRTKETKRLMEEWDRVRVLINPSARR